MPLAQHPECAQDQDDDDDGDNSIAKTGQQAARGPLAHRVDRIAVHGRASREQSEGGDEDKLD